MDNLEHTQHYFYRFDTDNKGTINAKDLQVYFKRRGEELTEEEANDILKKAELKATMGSAATSKSSSKDKETSSGPKEIDYIVFKKYIWNPSPESHSLNFLKNQSSLRFSEYKSKMGQLGQHKKSVGEENSKSIHASPIGSSISSNQMSENWKVESVGKDFYSFNYS